MARILTIPNFNDSELATRAAAGHRDAFAQIVSRYQSLVCSLAYSATGSLSQSEDLAQETFLAAWKGLRTLREPEKLRSWLCSIVRNMIANSMRSGKKEPINLAEPIDATIDLPSSDSLPVDRAISSEEESILWRSLEHIPQIYREPLILFYREDQSIEAVAQQLELSEEAAKQRLSRGRKLLKMEVEAFVETALKQSSPGREFTSAVLAGLPGLSLLASISTAGAASSKGTAVVKTGSLASLIGVILTPILGPVSAILNLIGAVKSARSVHEKALWKKTAAIYLVVLLVGIAAAFLVRDEGLSTLIIFGTIIALVSIAMATAVMVKNLRKKIQVEEWSVQERLDSILLFGGPESRGYSWNLYGWLILVSFCNPVAMLTVFAAKANDSIALFTILSILTATFLFSRQIVIQKPARFLNVWQVVMITQYPLLMIALHLRWEIWTGQSPWQLHSDALVLIIVGFVLFAFGLVHWLIKRN